MFDLKESDLPELERLSKTGAKWVARDRDDSVWGYSDKPEKRELEWDGRFCVAYCEAGALLCIEWSDPEPLNIAAAIAQIKAMKKPSLP